MSSSKVDNKTLAVIDGKTYRLPETEEEFQIIERMENRTIVKAMSGEIIQSYFYRFSRHGAEIVDLNAAGIFEIAQQYGRIECGIEINSTDKSPNYEMTAYAHDKIRDVKFYGSAQQAKRLPNGNEDIFAMAKCNTKSQRNALKKVLPYPLIRTLLLNYIAEEAKQELVTVRETAFQRLQEFGYSVELFNEFCTQKYGAEFCELKLEKAKRAASFIVIKKAKETLKSGN